MSNFQQVLIGLGIEPLASSVFVLLVEEGEQTVPAIQKKLELSRTSIYEALTSLLSNDLVEYRKEGRNAFYNAAHPNKLFGLMEARRKTYDLEEIENKEQIKNIIGLYNISNKKPGVRFYQGYEEFWNIYEETLNSEDTIYTIENEEAVIEMHGPMEEYDKKRIKKGIKQFILTPDTEVSRNLKKKTENDPLTEIKILPKKEIDTDATVDIYDGKILFATQREKEPIMVVIEDPEIYKLQRIMFEKWWHNLS